MLQQLLKDLVRDAQLQQSLTSAQTQEDAVQLLLAAGNEKGHRLTAKGIADTLSALMGEQPQDLGEEELLAVSGGLRCNTSGGFPPSTGSAHVGVCF